MRTEKLRGRSTLLSLNFPVFGFSQLALGSFPDLGQIRLRFAIIFHSPSNSDIRPVLAIDYMQALHPRPPGTSLLTPALRPLSRSRVAGF